MKKNQSGQALLLVLLGMAVILTVALSSVSQSVSDISVTNKEEEALRAFSAAEAGIEKAIISDFPLDSTQDPVIVSDASTALEVTYQTEVSAFPDGQYYVYPGQLLSGDVATIWLKPHTTSGYLDVSATGFNGNSLDFYWGEATTDTALEVSLWYLSGGSGPLTVKRIILDPGRSVGSTDIISGAIAVSTSSPPEEITADGRKYYFAHTYSLSFNPGGPFALTNAEKNNMYLLKVRTLLNDLPETIGVRAVGGGLPSQGKKVQSTGSSGESLRKIQVFELFPDIPGFFDSAITSNSDITKN